MRAGNQLSLIHFSRLQNGGAKDGLDMNVQPAWRKGYTGKGVVVSILDDGIQHNHPDLEQNYVSISPPLAWGRNGQARRELSFGIYLLFSALFIAHIEFKARRTWN